MTLYRWVNAKNGHIPEDAVVAGYEIESLTLYAGRAFHKNSLLPAKVSPKLGAAFILYAGIQHMKFEYQVLCSEITVTTWKPVKDNQIPINAMVIGVTRGGEDMYMGRTMYLDNLVPGKIPSSDKILHISFGGKEFCFEEYEILCIHFSNKDYDTTPI